MVVRLLNDKENDLVPDVSSRFSKWLLLCSLKKEKKKIQFLNSVENHHEIVQGLLKVYGQNDFHFSFFILKYT